MVFFPCQGDDDRANVGSETTGTPTTQQTNVINYTNAGGRVFATHYSYVWLFNDAPFSGTATWNVTQGSADTGTGTINTSFARGRALAQWLQIAGASTTFAQLPLNTLRYDFSGVTAPTLLWVQTSGLGNAQGVNGNNPPAAPWPTHLTFDTPVGTQAASQCGRVLFDDFHVENVTADTGTTFPSECPGGVMTAQEKMLEFMIFDLDACIVTTPPPPPPTCTSLNCAQQGIKCGPAGDGCGNEIASCGTCTAPQTCGGGGVAGQCGGTACVPLTCSGQGIKCGPAGDGCGNEIQCGNCSNGTTCGGGGTPGTCGKPACTPRTCGAQGIQCGPAGDGCGGALLCGACPAGQTCGGGGTPGKCGAPDGGACGPLTCAELNIGCGPAGDGCGGQLDCGGRVPRGETCGGGGTPGQCGKPNCIAEHVRRSWPAMRAGGRWLRRCPAVRRVPRQRELRNVRGAGHVRQLLHTDDLRGARLRLRPRRRRLRRHPAVRHLRGAAHVRWRRHAGRVRSVGGAVEPETAPFTGRSARTSRRCPLIGARRLSRLRTTR